MTRFTTSLFACLALLTSAAHAQDPRHELNEGSALYENGQFEQAAQAFERAADAAAADELDPAIANYDRANALMNMNKPDEASRYYQEALRTTDLDLQKRAYFNRGNALMAMAEPSQQQGQLDVAKKAVEEAISMYVGAMTLDPTDTDPKVNFELALQKKQELEEQQQQQQQQQQQDQSDQNDEKKQDPEQNEQQKQDQEQQEKGQQAKDQQEKEQQEKEPQSSGQEDKEQEDEPNEDEQQQAQPAKAEDMTREEAMQVLDALKQQEQADREKIRVSVGAPVPVEKDW